MKGFSLVKLLRATTIDTGHSKFSYEILVHTMSGHIETREDVKDANKGRDFSKELKMKGDNRCAIRYLNSYSWEILSEVEYDELVLEWNK